MSATEELRRLLDERGEEHSDVSGLTLWLKEGNHYNALATERVDGSINLVFDGLTPEQTINTTLGRGKCKWELVHSGPLYDKWQCSCCGYEFVEPRTGQGYTDMEPNFCPNCGREVER